jgi:group I intron endonuclease
MFIGYIYKTTNLINGRCYIGKKNKSVFDENYYGSGIALQSAIKKYGRENFTIEVLHWANTINELNQLERNSIALYEGSGKLYNIARGGNGGDTTTNHPNKISIVKERGNKIKEWHQSLTTDEKSIRSKKISSSKKGKTNGHTGLKHSKSTIEKMKQLDKSYTQTPEWKTAHTLSMAQRRGQPLTKKYKPVIVNDIEYPSIKDAMLALEIKHRATFYTMVAQQKLKVIYK